MSAKKVLIYTFYNRFGFTSRLLYDLDINGINKFFINNGLLGVGSLLKNISVNKYDLIIGLGNYRKNAKYIRAEMTYQNKYGSRPIVNEGSEILESNFERTEFFDKDFVKTCNKLSNGPCNRSAYLVMHKIVALNLSSKFIFLHMPRNMDRIPASELLRNICE